MRNFFSAFAIIVFGVFLAFTISTSKPKPEKNTETAPEPISVNAIIAHPQAIAVNVKTHGILEASQEIDVIAEIDGKITHAARRFVQGGIFKADETLLNIDDTDYRVAVAQARSELAKAQETVATERARSEQAKKEWRDLGSDAANSLFLRKPQLASAKAAEKAAQAHLQQAQANLGKTRVSVPFAHRIISTEVHRGQFVRKGNKLARVYATGKLQVLLPLTQAQLKVLNLSWPLESDADTQQQVAVTLSSQIGNNKLSWPATVLHGSAQIDRHNQLAQLMVELADNQKSALPGLYVTAEITGSPQDNLLLIPEEAFHDKRYVLVAQNGLLQFRAAQFLARKGQHLIVKADVKEGETLLIDRLPLATPNMAVAPILQDSNANIDTDTHTQHL